MIEPATAIELCRFLHDSALLLLWGSAAYLAFLTPRDLAEETWMTLGAAPFVAALVALATTIVSLPLEAAAIGDGWADAVNAGTVHDVLFDSSVGVAWQAQAAAAVLLMLAFLTGARRRIPAIALGAALSIATLVASGHASLHQGWLSALHRGNDAIHMLSAGAWLGALLPFVLILRQLDDENHSADAQSALKRFSTAGHLAVALVLASGLANTALVLGRWPADWSSPYQRLLIVKITAVCGMVGLAIANRYVFVPAIAGNGSRAIRAIRFGSIAEILIGMFVIAVVSAFGMLDPV